MSGDSSDAVHKALKTALLAAPEITELVGQRVFDWQPAGEIFPQITIGDILAMPDNADGYQGAELIVTLHTWARGETARAAARQIGEAISRLLDENEEDLPVIGHRVISIMRQMSQVLRDEASDAQLAGTTAHGVYRYRILTAAES